MAALLLVALGGALGSVLRHLGGGAVQRLVGGAFPAGTLVVNLIGSFLLAIIVHAAAVRSSFPAEARLFLTTGVMGGFTTYSSFNHETLALLGRGATLLALANLAGTVLGCLIAGVAGLALARAVLAG